MMRANASQKEKRYALACCLVLAGCATTTPQDSLFREGVYVQSSGTSADAPAQSQPIAQSHPLETSPTLGAADPVIRPQVQDRRSTGTAPTRRPVSGTEDKVILNFVDVDIQAVISALSRFLGKNFLMDPRVKGQITLVSDGEIPSATAYDMLGAALRMRGFTIVDVGKVSRVVPVADAKLQGGSVNATAPRGGIGTRTFRLAYENADALVPVLKPMIAPESSIAAYAANNTLVITDYIDNLERIARIIESIDTPASLDTDIIKIHNGVATDIAGLANELLQGSGKETRSDIVVLADPRSNSVIVRSSSPARTLLARDLLVKLDKTQEDPGNLHVVYLRNAQAAYLSGVLKGLFTGDSGGTALGSGDSARAALGAGGMLGGAGATGSKSGNSSTGKTNSSTSGSSTRSTANNAGASQQGVSGNTGTGTAFSANGVTVQADATTNTLIIAAPEPMYRSIRRVIDMLDQRRAQVLVESLIVEVTEDDSAQLGIQWMRNNGRFIGGAKLGGAGLNNSATNTIDLLPKGLNLGIVDGSVNIPGVGEILNLNLLAQALQTKSGVNILSTPNILTLDNEVASIIVGKTVPFVSGQYITSGSGSSNNPFQTVERQDIGLQLKIRPQISEGGTVKLDIYQEVSSIDEQNSVSAGIVTNKRALDTSVLLDDGQIMVLGGLLEDSVTNSTNSVPGLGSIPLLGYLFRSDKRQRTKTNLMVFLRPYVIRDANAGRGLTQDRYNFIRTQQSRGQVGKHQLLPDMAAPILPPADVPVAGSRPKVDLRAEQWSNTREQQAPATQTLEEVRERPTQAAPKESERRTQPSPNLGVSSDPAVLHATPEYNRSVLQVADVPREEDAVRIAKRIRISGMPAYIVSGPGGIAYAVRVDLPRDSRAVDTATGVLRELGYHPEIVVTP